MLTLTAGTQFLGTGQPDGVALVAGAEAITYRQLRMRVAARRAELDLPERSLVVLEARNTEAFVVTYLALLDAGHVPLLTGDHAERLTAAWHPNATISGGAEPTIARHHQRRIDLHPDLALLLSTSGSTGSPKLVRLSHRNLVSNALAIAESLGLTERDRAITSLPLHYCYGLSVLHSHLAVGAGTVLTEASVVDPCFVRALVDGAVTSLAGVPHTFELLEQAGPERLADASLKRLTCAGGRLAPARARRWADRCSSWGAELVLMYGQTEATARMAYLPPSLLPDHPDAAGVAIPGGEFAVRSVDGVEPGVGELVYRGDNVMMGYAEREPDLARGAELDELATGDLGWVGPDGLVHVVGRRARFVKPFGLRLDLDGLERDVAAAYPGAVVALGGDDNGLAAVVEGVAPATVAAELVRRTGLPASHVAVASGPLPLTSSGKVDHAAVRARAVASSREPSAPAGTVASVFATVLGRTPNPTDTFVSLGGDSLNYVECSVRLERDAGTLPADWHLMAVADLERAVRPRRRWALIDTTVVARAVGICAIVATHMHLRYLPGGAHLLLGVVGYNAARFLVPIADTGERVRAGLRTIGRTAGPTMAWVAVGMLLFGAYSPGTLLLVNNYVGPPGHGDDQWHFWFIEVMVHLLIATTALLAIPAVARLERRWSYGFALGLLAVALVGRSDWAQWFDPGNLRYRTHAVAWFFVLGWLVQRSRTWPQRAATLAVLALTIPGTFVPQRDLFIGVGLAVLVVAPRLVWPRIAVAPIAAIASASLWILLTHFTVWPLLDAVLDRRVAYVLTITVGVLVHLVVERLNRAWPWRRTASSPQAVMAATISS